MKKKTTIHLLVILVALVPLGYLGLVWEGLPPQVPVHFGADMKPDRIGKKEELWFVSSLLAVVSVGVYFLLNNLNRIDPKRQGNASSSTFNKLALGLVIFMAALNIIIITSARGDMDIQRFLFPLLGGLFAFIGNYMNNIKPNYFAGIRLPWTLSSDENWRRTHQLAGKLWFGGGLVIAIAGLVLPASVALPVFIGLMVVMVLIPATYSYWLFHKQV
jgi:uncharacterized membrane protein